MKRLVLALLLLAVSSGCMRPIFVGEARVKGPSGGTYYTTLDPKMGEIAFPSYYRRFAYEADVFVDTQYVGTIRSGGGRIFVKLERFGNHEASATVYFLRGNRRGEEVGRFYNQFTVYPDYASGRSNIPGVYWKINIYYYPTTSVY